MSNTVAMAMLKGNWVTSFTGWQWFDVRPKPDPRLSGQEQVDDLNKRVRNLPPMIGGTRWIAPHSVELSAGGPFDIAGGALLGESFELREGYFLVTALIRLALDGKGGLKGVMEFIRGGVRVVDGELDSYRRRLLTGTYEVREDADLAGAFEGSITETHAGDGPQDHIWSYGFVVRSQDELEYFWKVGSERPLLATGTLKRMNFAPSAEEVHPSNTGISVG